MECLIEVLQKARSSFEAVGRRMVTWGRDGSWRSLTRAKEGSAVRGSTPLIVDALVMRCRAVVMFQLGKRAWEVLSTTLSASVILVWKESEKLTARVRSIWVAQMDCWIDARWTRSVRVLGFLVGFVMGGFGGVGEEVRLVEYT